MESYYHQSPTLPMGQLTIPIMIAGGVLLLLKIWYEGLKYGFSRVRPYRFCLSTRQRIPVSIKERNRGLAILLFLTGGLIIPFLIVDALAYLVYGPKGNGDNTLIRLPSSILFPSSLPRPHQE